jgi:hypothetical protein
MEITMKFILSQKHFEYLNNVVFILFLFVIFSCKNNDDVLSPTEEDTPLSKKKWTFLLYDDADFSDAYDPLNDFKSAICSNKNMHVLVLQDKENGPTTIWYIDSAKKNIKFKYGTAEFNMGSSETLSSF